MTLRPEDYTRTRLTLSVQRGHLEAPKSDTFFAQAVLGLRREGWSREGFVSLSGQRNMADSARWLPAKTEADEGRDVRVNRPATSAGKALLGALLEETWRAYPPMVAAASNLFPALPGPSIEHSLRLSLNTVVPTDQCPHWFVLSSLGGAQRSYWANFELAQGCWVWALPDRYNRKLYLPTEAFETVFAEFAAMALAIAGLGQPLPSVGP